MAEADRPQAEPGTERVLLRAAVGAVAMVRDRVNLAAASSRRPGSAREDDAPPPRPKARHVVIGLLASGPALTRRMLRRYAIRLSTRAPTPVDRMWAEAARTRPARMFSRWHRAARARLGRVASDLAAIGAAEEREGRVLLTIAMTAAVDQALDLLAVSPQVQQVIREQSVGLTEGAVVEMRKQSARADDLAEAAIRRLLHGRAPPTGAKRG
jgi:hypothetical protein